METASWTPSSSRIEQSNMFRYMSFLQSEHKYSFKSYNELYRWSIQEPEKFWPTIWDFCGVLSSRSWDSVLIGKHKMPGATWFKGSKLNFAENLLKRQDDKPAIIFKGENARQDIITYQTLYKRVAELANALRNAGISTGDRVVGYLPNVPEAIISMLATTSIGAVWSSCSPDFGTHGVLDRFGQIQPKILITTDGYSYNGKPIHMLRRIKQLSSNLPELQQIIVLPYLDSNLKIKNINKAVLYSDFIKESYSKIIYEQLPFNHPLYIMYSSGTTGRPKCIVHGAGGTLLQHLKELILHSDLKSEDRIFYFTTCGWMMWNWLVSSLAVGATVVLYDGSPVYPKASSLFDLIDEVKISIFGTSAKFLAASQKACIAAKQTHDLSSLKTILSTGSPLLPEQYEYVYQDIKKDVLLASISGGTDIISCFALGNPMLPVYYGQLQCRGLGMSVKVFNDQGQSVQKEKGELVCTKPFPSMPIYFWDDIDGKKYKRAYFEKFANVWAHGDYAELTEQDGMIIYGRSDTILNPGGVRIGTAEIYRQVELLPEVLESIVVGQEWQNDIRIILFVKLSKDTCLDDELMHKIRTSIRENASPRHVPKIILQVPDIPRTISGKIVELAVREVIHNRQVKNLDAIANPEALEYFRNLPELK